VSSEPTYEAPAGITRFADTTTDVSALAGASLGRRERMHGNLRAITEIAIAEVVEEIADLAVADRVAFVLARRTGMTHAVIARPGSYLVVTLTADIGSQEAWSILQAPSEPPLASIVNPDGITPILRGIDLDTPPSF
jgi:hypothetical protein